MSLPDRISVIGAGLMGRGIAYVSAVAGAEVVVIDSQAEAIAEARRHIEVDLERAVDRGILTSEQAAASASRVSTTGDLAAGCEGAGLVIEAVVEQLAVKQEVLRAAERASAPGSILATNTSALSITAIASALEEPGRGVGMHFFNPVPKMKLVELVRGLQTDASTLDRAEAAARSMGKVTVRVEDVPGFATSRINALIGVEAMRMLEEGVACAEDIDTAVKLGLNHPMGPLEMGDLVGWDTRLRILEHLAATLGERYRPTTLHRRLVAAGRFGVKSGRGVYRYDEQGGRI